LESPMGDYGIITCADAFQRRNVIGNRENGIRTYITGSNIFDRSMIGVFDKYGR